MLRTECILDWSPGARVGKAWLNLEVTKGSGVFDSLESGIAVGMWVLVVAGVGGKGKGRKSGSMSMPGIKALVWTARVLDLDPVGRWRVCDAMEDESMHVLGMCQWYEYQGLTSMSR